MIKSLRRPVLFVHILATLFFIYIYHVPLLRNEMNYYRPSIAGEADVDAATLAPVNGDTSSADAPSIAEGLLAAGDAEESLPP